MLSATTLWWVHASGVLHGNSPWCCLPQCARSQSRGRSSVSMPWSAFVGRVISGKWPLKFSKGCLKRKWLKMSLPTWVSSMLVRRACNAGSWCPYVRLCARSIWHAWQELGPDLGFLYHEMPGMPGHDAHQLFGIQRIKVQLEKTTCLRSQGVNAESSWMFVEWTGEGWTAHDLWHVTCFSKFF